MAHLVERSARQGDAGAVALLVRAGEQAAERAPGTAARWYGGALRLLDDGAPADERVEILLRRAQSLAATGRFRDAHEALVESLGLSPASPALRARVTAACAGVERHLGLHEQANARLTAQLGEIEPGSKEAIAVLLELALDGFYRVPDGTMHRWAEQALQEAQVLRDRTLVAAGHATMALAGAWTGDVAKAESARTVALGEVDALSDDELATRIDAAADLAAAELYLDHFAECGRHAERVFRVGRATGQGQTFSAMYAAASTALWMDGRLAEAGDVLDGAVDAARLIDDEIGVAFGLPFAAALADRAVAAELALASAHKADSAGAHLDAHVARVLAGRALRDVGRDDEALEAVSRAAEAFAAYGARRYLAGAERELRRLGSPLQRRRPRVGSGTGFESLTAREREIAVLTADRLTNRQIAQCLFLSEKTIETHLRKVFQKLGVTSRVEVARVAERAAAEDTARAG